MKYSVVFVVIMIGALSLTGCSEKATNIQNKPEESQPMINAIKLSQSVAVPHQTVTVAVQVEDTGNSCEYYFAGDGSILTSDDPRVVFWTPPSTVGSHQISVVVSDKMNSAFATASIDVVTGNINSSLTADH